MSDGPRDRDMSLTTVRQRSVAAWLGCAGAWPAALLAQRRGTLHRIGIVSLRPTADSEGPQPRSPQVAALLHALGKMGYVYGDHYVTIATGVAGHPLGMVGAVQELVRQKPDVIVVDACDFRAYCTEAFADFPRARMIVIGPEPDTSYGAVALENGAGAWLPRERVSDDLGRELRRLLGCVHDPCPQRRTDRLRSTYGGVEARRR